MGNCNWCSSGINRSEDSTNDSVKERSKIEFSYIPSEEESVTKISYRMEESQETITKDVTNVSESDSGGMDSSVFTFADSEDKFRTDHTGNSITELSIQETQITFCFGT